MIRGRAGCRFQGTRGLAVASGPARRPRSDLVEERCARGDRDARRLRRGRQGDSGSPDRDLRRVRVLRDARAGRLRRTRGSSGAARTSTTRSTRCARGTSRWALPRPRDGGAEAPRPRHGRPPAHARVRARRRRPRRRGRAASGPRPALGEPAPGQPLETRIAPRPARVGGFELGRIGDPVDQDSARSPLPYQPGQLGCGGGIECSVLRKRGAGQSEVPRRWERSGL
jgi:hypothetical protein